MINRQEIDRRRNLEYLLGLGLADQMVNLPRNVAKRAFVNGYSIINNASYGVSTVAATKEVVVPKKKKHYNFVRFMDYSPRYFHYEERIIGLSKAGYNTQEISGALNVHPARINQIFLRWQSS